MESWADRLDALVAGTDDAPHLAVLCFPPLQGWEPGRVWTNWQVDDTFLTPLAGTLFGGYIAAMADHFLACAVLSVLSNGQSFATAELHVHFLSPVREGTLEIEAKVVSQGSRSAYCEATFIDATSRLVSRAGVTQMIRSINP